MIRLLALALLLAGCGVRPSEVILGGPAPVVPRTTAVYLVSGDRVVPVPRTGPDGLTQLADGPTATEREQGYTTEVPTGTTFSPVVGSTVTASVDVTTLPANAVTQIVCTAVPETVAVTVVGGGQTLGPRVCPVV